MNNTYYITHFTEYKRWDQRVIWMDSIKIELNTVDKEFLLLLLRWWRRIHYFAHLIEWYSWMYGISSMPIDGSFIQLETANEYWWLITKYDWCQDEEGPQYQFGIEVGLIIELCIEHGCCLFGYTVLYSDSIVMIVGECISYLCGFLKAWLLD